MIEYQYKIIKDSIQQLIQEGRFDEAKVAIREVKSIFQYDPDFYVIEANLYYLKGSYGLAKAVGNRGLELNVNHVELLYCMWRICFERGEYEEALKYYIRAIFIQELSKEEKIEMSIENAVDQICSQIEAKTQTAESRSNEYKNILEIVKEAKESFISSNYTFFPKKNYNEESFFGDWVEHAGKSYFVGYYNYEDRIKVKDIESLRFMTKCEIFKASKAKEFYGGTPNKHTILPIAYLQEDTTIEIIEINTGNIYELSSERVLQYHYYKVSGEYKLISNNDIVVGDPILLEKDTTKKDLVLSIFIDGLSYSFLELEGIEQLMPNTANYFKNGCIFTNNYTTGDWTLPCAASLCTGLYTTNHGVFHPKMQVTLPENQPSLFELFKTAGYTTAKIDGVYRVTPTYGYIRGIDRTIYQPSHINMDGKDVVIEAIKHIETFKDTNQYLWLGFMDIHDAGSEEHRSILQQTQMGLEFRKYLKEEKKKSVYESYSETRIARYRESIKELDLYLGILFHYIETHFEEDNVIVSLMSDHGQAYLVKEEDCLLQEERTRVPMLFKGYKKGICEEYTEITDYLPILLDAAQIKDPLSKERDGSLPRFCGGAERGYSYAEEIYPGNPYEAFIRTKDYDVSFITKERVLQDGRIPFNINYVMTIKDKKGAIIEDEGIYEHFYNIIKEHVKKNRLYE